MADLAERNPYKLRKDDESSLNQIWAQSDEGLRDLGELSATVKALEPFRAYRLYYRDDSAKKVVDDLLEEVT